MSISVPISVPSFCREAKACLRKTDARSKQEHEKLKTLERKQRESVDAEEKAVRKIF